MSSIYQIRKAVRRPQDLDDHQHNLLLQSIAHRIQNSKQTIHLYKVKGHSYLIGNEKADEIAKAAAKGDAPLDCCRQFNEPSNDRRGRHWPYTKKETEHQGTTKVEYQPLTDLKAAIKRQCHGVCHLGKSNQHTTYFEAWKKVEDMCDMEASNAFMKENKSVTPQERTTALKYRYGAMYTRKLAHRYGHATDSKCLLCGQEDGGHHTASGCPKLTEMYTSRHNKIGRQIMTRILRGRKGGYLTQMDLGAHERCLEDDISQNVPRNIPWTMLPPAVQDAYAKTPTLKNLRPDGILYKPATATKPAKYWIIEVKVCRDTEPQDKLDQAQSQHKTLLETLQAADPRAKIHYCPLLVGVTGAIYKNTKDHLETLGVNGTALTKCLKQIHITAIQQLHNIYRTKRNTEKKTLGEGIS